MTTPEFAARLQAKLEETAQYWRDQFQNVNNQIMVIVLDDLADCIRHALIEPKPRYKKRTNRRKK